MVLATEILVLLHLIGFAALFGGLIVQVRSPEPEVNPTMVHGALAQLITGVALVALAELTSTPVDWVKVLIKTAISGFLVLITVRNRRFLSIPRGLWALLTALTLANAAIAVLWA